MTEAQFDQLKFRGKSFWSFDGVHEAEYWNDEYGIGRLETTSMRTGKKDIQYYFAGTDKCYQTKKELLKAIENLRVISEDYETPDGCKIIDIRLKNKKK